ncbi:MAG TPA: hypothetical protein VFO65_10660 [Acidimicrobiales bacterium]|nr:hypothetical protein [Acidimicrobiales bacterium]
MLSAVLLTLLALAVTSVVKTGAEGPDPALVFADEVRPAVDLSVRQAAALEDLRAQAGTMDRGALRKGVDRLARESQAALGEVGDVDVERRLRPAQGLLVTCLTTRVKALEALSATLAGEFEAGPPQQAVDAMVEVGRDLAVSDQAYELFLESLPEAARSTMPASRWVVDETRYARPEMAAFVAILRSKASLAPVQDVSLITATVEPAPVGMENGAAVLPLSKTVRLQVVVVNAGSVAAKRVPVEVVSVSTGGMDTGRQFVDLAPGQRAVVPVTVRPSPVGVIELTVRVGPVAGETSITDNTQVTTYVMR